MRTPALPKRFNFWTKRWWEASSWYWPPAAWADVCFTGIPLPLPWLSLHLFLFFRCICPTFLLTLSLPATVHFKAVSFQEHPSEKVKLTRYTGFESFVSHNNSWDARVQAGAYPACYKQQESTFLWHHMTPLVTSYDTFGDIIWHLWWHHMTPKGRERIMLSSLLSRCLSILCVLVPVRRCVSLEFWCINTLIITIM